MPFWWNWEIASSQPVVEATKPKIDAAVAQANFQNSMAVVDSVQRQESISSGKSSTPLDFSIQTVNAISKKNPNSTEDWDSRKLSDSTEDWDSKGSINNLTEEAFNIAEKYKNNPDFDKAIKEKSSQISAQIDQTINNNPNISDKEKAKQILTFWATINDPKNSDLKKQLIANWEYQKFMDWYNSLDQNHIFSVDISDYKTSPSAERFIASSDKKDNFLDLWLDLWKQQQLKEIYLDANQNLFSPLPDWITFEDYKATILNKNNFRWDQNNAPKIALVLQMLNDPKIHQAHSDMINLISKLDTSTNQSHKLYALNAMKTMLTTSIAWDFHIDEVVVNENPLSFGAKADIEWSKIDITWSWSDILITQYAWKDESWNIKILSKKINDTFSLPSPSDIMNSKPDINLATIFKEKKSSADIKSSIDETIKKNFDSQLQKPSADFSRQRLEMSWEANGQAMLEKIISFSSPSVERQNFLNWNWLNEQNKSFRPMLEKYETARKNMNINEQRQAMQIFSNSKFQNFVKFSEWNDWKEKNSFDMFNDLKIFDISRWKFDIQKMRDFSDALSMPDLSQFNRKLLEKNIDLKKTGYEFSSKWDDYFLKDTGKRWPTTEDDYLNVLYWASSQA